MTEDEFAAYQSLAEETEDHRWAFGTGFTDPLAGHRHVGPRRRGRAARWPRTA